MCATLRIWGVEVRQQLLPVATGGDRSHAIVSHQGFEYVAADESVGAGDQYGDGLHWYFSLDGGQTGMIVLDTRTIIPVCQAGNCQLRAVLYGLVSVDQLLCCVAIATHPLRQHSLADGAGFELAFQPLQAFIGYARFA